MRLQRLVHRLHAMLLLPRARSQGDGRWRNLSGSRQPLWDADCRLFVDP